jgi:DNA-binding transcriptional LysR family regulator
MEIVQLCRRAIHEAHESKHNESHRLRIGVSTCHPPNLIEVLHSVELRLYKNLSVEIVTAYSFELMAHLQHHELDLVILTSPPPNALITSACFATNPFLIMLRERHPLAGKTSVKLNELGPYPWVFFNRNIHHHMHDLILQRIKAESAATGVRHSVSQEEHAVALLTDDQVLAWLTPTGAQRNAHSGFKSIPLDDPQIRLEMHIATLANNRSPMVSEYVRTFMKRIEEQRPPLQLQLPIGMKGDN